MTGENEPVVIELWSDLGCPWCYLGKHRLETAIAQRPDADRFEVRLRSYELDPHAAGEPEPILDHLARKYGGAPPQVQAMEARVQALAAADGLPYSTDRDTANTFDVHRLQHYAAEQGLGTALFGAVQDGYFAGTLNPFDTEQLLATAWTPTASWRCWRVMPTPTPSGPMRTRDARWVPPASRSPCTDDASPPPARRASRATPRC